MDIPPDWILLKITVCVSLQPTFSYGLYLSCTGADKWAPRGSSTGSRTPMTEPTGESGLSPRFLIWLPSAWHQRGRINTSFTFLITRPKEIPDRKQPHRHTEIIWKCSRIRPRVTHVALMSYWQTQGCSSAAKEKPLTYGACQAVTPCHQKCIRRGVRSPVSCIQWGKK